MAPKGEHVGYNLRNRRMVGMFSVSCTKHNGGTNTAAHPKSSLAMQQNFKLKAVATADQLQGWSWRPWWRLLRTWEHQYAVAVVTADYMGGAKTMEVGNSEVKKSEGEHRDLSLWSAEGGWEEDALWYIALHSFLFWNPILVLVKL